VHRGWVWLASILAPLLMGPAHGRNIPVFVDGANEIVVVKRPAIAGSINVVSGWLPKGAAVTIGSSKRLIRGDRRFAYTAPGSGTYRVTPTTPSSSCSFSPSYVDVTLGPDATVTFNATCGPAPIDSAVFVSQSVSEVLTAGGTYTVTVTVQNNGTSTWTPGQYFLALTNVAWSPRIVNLTSSVSPGQTITFSFDLTVPQQTGDYSVRWQMSTPDATFGPMTADMSISVVPAVQLSYIHTDALGTPRLITSATTNNVLWRWDNLEPFGNNAPDENPSGLGTFTYNYRFPGQYFDAETGTHYNYFRDYDPSIGRYVESDPIGLDAGPNTYGYVSQNPPSLTDPWGLQVPPIGLGGFSAAGAGGSAAAGGGVGSGSSSGSAAIALGLTHLIHKIVEACTKDCDPPKGTVCFFIDRVPPSKPHFPIPGSHYHLFQMNQAPDGSCHWNYLGASATAPPGSIPCPFERAKTR